MIEFEAPDWQALHSSLSRRRRFAFCPVGYYLYHVPGRDGYDNHPDDWHWQIYCAKHAVTARGWVEQLFRKAVRSYFTPGDNFRHKKFANFVRVCFEKDFSLLESNAAVDDPKVVPEVINGQNHDFSLYDFYDQAVFDLNNMISSFSQTALFEDLYKQPYSAFRNISDAFRWQLGGVNFSAVPDLVWSSDSLLNVLDMNQYGYAEERIRQAELFRVYIYSFMQIAPARVAVYNFDLQKFSLIAVPSPEEDFTQVFQQLYGEAAMWRDYLMKQAAEAGNGVWHYAQLDKCTFCRFGKLCPARNGTAEVENRSIISKEDRI